MLSAGVSLGLIGCGGGDATRVAALSVRADAQQQNPDALTSGASCEALLATFQRRLIEQVTERAASMRGGEPAAYYGGVFTDDVAPRSGAALAAARSQALDGAAPLDSEPSTASPGSEDGDIVKVSGDRVYLLHGPSLYVLDAASPELALASEVALEGEPTQLFVTGDRALVLSRIIGPLLGADELYSPYAYYSATYTKLTLLDAESDPPVVLRELYVEGDAEAPIAARREQSEVRAVIQRASKAELDYPVLDYTDIYGQRRSLEALRPQVDAWEEISIESIQASTLTDYVPRTFERRADELVELAQRCPDYWLPGAGLTPAGFTTLVTLDLADPGAALGGFTLLGNTDATYFQADSVILRQTDYSGPGTGLPGIDTVLHRFTLDGTAAVYSASGRIDGYISGAAALDERGGVLRAAATQDLFGPPVEGGEAPYLGTSSHVLTLEPNDGWLIEIGRSAEFAANQFITPTTVAGDRVYVVTTNESPGQLLVVDTADPRAPALVGELQTNGYVNLVHPLSHDRLLGVGVAPNASGYPSDFALQLFDAADPSAPALLGEYVFPTQAYSEASYRTGALRVDAAGERIAFPLRRYDTDVSSVEVFGVVTGLERLGSVVPERYQPGLEECLAILGYPSDPASLAALEENPELRAVLLEQCSGYFEQPAARRGLFLGDNVLAFTTNGAESYALSALDGPALAHIPLPQIYVYP